MTVVDLLAGACLIPTIGGSVYTVLAMLAVLWFMRARAEISPVAPHGGWPGVTILKPVCGLERGLEARLRGACLQEYPEFQVVIPVQNAGDPAIPLVRGIERDFGRERAAFVLHDVAVGPNGKVTNLLGAMVVARHDVLVISDSDVALRPDYLKSIVAPLADERVAAVNTLFKATGARRWYERLELLSLNADFIPSVVFSEVTGAAGFCLGPSVAIRRSMLESIGGFEALSEYLAEDYELGRRVWESGRKLKLVPYVVDVVLDLSSWRTWWKHQVYWDQNTRVANPVGFLATVLIRSVPFAILFALLRLGDSTGLLVLFAALAARLASVVATAYFGFADREVIRNLWLLPIRDIVGLASWAFAFGQRTVEWRGSTFVLKRDGRMVPASPTR